MPLPGEAHTTRRDTRGTTTKPCSQIVRECPASQVEMYMPQLCLLDDFRVEGHPLGAGSSKGAAVVSGSTKSRHGSSGEEGKATQQQQQEEEQPKDEL